MINSSLNGLCCNTHLGNLPGILRPNTAAEVEFSWFKEHGTALRIKGAFGVSLLGSKGVDPDFILGNSRIYCL